MTRQERRAQRRSRRANIAVASMIGATSLAFGSLAVSGAFPGGSPPKSVPPAEASHTGADHAPSGISQADAHVPAEQAGTTDAGSRLDGLETAARNVTNPVASAVITTLMENSPGPGFGAQAADAATSAASERSPSSTPSEASDGQEHKP